MGVPKDYMNVDGLPSDGVGHDVASPEQLAKFDEARETLSRFRTPILVHADNPHERLFIAAFDGTGNDKFADPTHATNVAKISDQIEAAHEAGNKQVYVNYLEGPGTQSNPLMRTWDLATGFSYEDRLEKMYKDLVKQAWEWQQADPHVQIRVHSIGFSRGASQAAGFTQLLHERGIRDITSRTIDVEGREIYTRHIAPPGQTLQTVGLFDPVATGEPMNYDRRPAPSVVSGLQLTALDEHRAAFPSDQVMQPGLSEDGRFLNVMVPGAHSDVGGSYHRDGLAARSCNLMIDYCNAMGDKPYLHKYYEPNDPRLNVVHRSWEGMLPYQLDPREAVRGEPSGTNTQLAPMRVTEAGELPHSPSPLAPELAERVYTLPRQGVPIGPVPAARDTRLPLVADPHAAALEAGHSVSLAPKVAATLGAAAVAYDATTTFHRAVDLQHQGNLAGSQSTIVHFAGRNIGMLAGAELTATVGAVLGVESGPGMLVTGALGGIAGAVGGDKVADAVDTYRIYHQDDPHGQTWRYDPKQPQQGWTRDLPPLPDTPHGQHIQADPALSDRLNYQASSTAVELQLARPFTPVDPYTQPAGPHDTPSQIDAPWTRDAQTKQWSRTVTDQVMEHGLKSAHAEVATPQRAGQLDVAAQNTIADNLAHSQRGMAERYQAAYQHYGWQQHGPMPAAVADALRAPANTVQASDGHTYTRTADGQWTTPSRVFGTNAAEGNVRDELDATQLAGNANAAAASSEAAAAPQTPVAANRRACVHPDWRRTHAPRRRCTAAMPPPNGRRRRR
ncbi:phospholipase effector Tle1 domain-containing protein [Dyella koreensis]|uniref:DUF2235 domain-containing protein n=1 Tax=Dyella koreensis TaxID=311235 RepID=A0ABW8K2E9_9GAMM